MSNFSQLEESELEQLTCPTNDRWRLDRLMGGLDSADNPGPRFESLYGCWVEDRRRVNALENLPRQLYAGVNGWDAESEEERYARKGCNPADIAKILSTGINTQRIQNCAASAAYMRERRLALL